MPIGINQCVKRLKPGEKPFFEFTEEQRTRMAKHLLDIGYQRADFEPPVWPSDDAVMAYRQHSGLPWQFKFKADVLREKREQMEQNLRDKRQPYDRIIVRALYVWVFFCPGISGVYRGWWTYFRGLGHLDYRGDGGFKGDASYFHQQLMTLFQVRKAGWLFPLSYDEWMPLFAEQYQCGCWAGKPQGKAMVWAQVKGNDLVTKIIGKAKSLHKNKVTGEQ